MNCGKNIAYDDGVMCTYGPCAIQIGHAGGCLLASELVSEVARPALATETVDASARLTPGTVEAVCEAVRMLCGEAPVYLTDSEQWSLPDDTGGFFTAVRKLVVWLDDNAPNGGRS